MALFESTNDGLGLDIGNSSIKAIWLKKSRGLVRLMAYDDKPLPDGAFSKDSIIKKDELAKTISELLAKSKLRPINIKKVNCALPETATFIKSLKMPVIPEEELKDAILLEIKQFVPLSLDKVFWDWRVINKEKNKQEVFLAVAPQQIVNDFYEVVAKAGLEINALEVEPLVIGRALINKQLSKQPVFIVDIGGGTTNFSLVFNESIKFTHNILNGGKTQTETLAKFLNIDLSKAEEIKVNLETNGKLEEKVKKALDPMLKNLANEIKRSVNFCEEQIKSKKINLILLCGGGANLSGIDKYLSDLLKIQVEIGNPWTNVTTYPLKTVPRNEIPLYAQAIGSALRDIKES
jgi:type IV pilus assembly protein PilM